MFKSSASRMATANHLGLITLIAISLILLLISLGPQQTPESHMLKRSKIKALKKVAIAASVLGNRKKVMIPLPIPLPLPIPIIHKHEPIISPIDPLLTLAYAKGTKSIHGSVSGIGGGYGGYGRR